MRLTRVHNVVAAALAAGTALTLTGCTGGDDAEASATGGGATSVSSDAANPDGAGPDGAGPDSASPDASEDASVETPADDARGPVERLLADAYAFLDSDSAQEARMEQLIAECMTAEGWEYLPVRSIPLDAPADTIDGLKWGTPEFAAAYGYGISTGEGLGLTRDIPGIAEGRSDDPNIDYVESLSESASTAYYEALEGIGATGERDYVIGTGCRAVALKILEGDAVDPWTDEKHSGLFEEMQLARNLAFDDQRVVEARGAWSECMIGAGFSDVVDSSAAQDLIYDEIDLYPDNDQTPSAGELAELQAREILLATADFGCREKHDYIEVEREVRFEREQEFIDSHRTEIDDLLAAVAEYRTAVLS